ncbi:hypothetical protein B0E43_11275 [Algoriphagus sp. A40]|nr:hypothetical protein B0E43_11275 [Algoriphagus sp. A40]
MGYFDWLSISDGFEMLRVVGLLEDGRPRTEDGLSGLSSYRGWKTEDGRPRTEDGLTGLSSCRPSTPLRVTVGCWVVQLSGLEDGRRKTEDRGWKTGCRGCPVVRLLGCLDLRFAISDFGFRIWDLGYLDWLSISNGFEMLRVVGLLEDGRPRTEDGLTGCPVVALRLRSG